jgi:hypothetical protein
MLALTNLRKTEEEVIQTDAKAQEEQEEKVDEAE